MAPPGNQAANRENKYQPIVSEETGLLDLRGEGRRRIVEISVRPSKYLSPFERGEVAMAEENSLLFMLQANVNPENEQGFDDWHNSYLRNLTKIPGCTWANRYRVVRGDLKYMSLCQIEDASYLPLVLGSDPENRHPIANADLQKLNRLPGLRNLTMNVYEQIMGTPVGLPLFCSDRPISVVAVNVAPDKEATWNHWYNTSHVPNLLRLPGYALGGRFRLLEHPELKWLNMKPKYAALYELEGLAAIEVVGNREKMTPGHLAELQIWEKYTQFIISDLSWNIYKVVAKHWKFQQYLCFCWIVRSPLFYPCCGPHFQ